MIETFLPLKFVLRILRGRNMRGVSHIAMVVLAYAFLQQASQIQAMHDDLTHFQDHIQNNDTRISFIEAQLQVVYDESLRALPLKHAQTQPRKTP